MMVMRVGAHLCMIMIRQPHGPAGTTMLPPPHFVSVQPASTPFWNGESSCHAMTAVLVLGAQSQAAQEWGGCTRGRVGAGEDGAGDDLAATAGAEVVVLTFKQRRLCAFAVHSCQAHWLVLGEDLQTRPLLGRMCTYRLPCMHVVAPDLKHHRVRPRDRAL